MKLKWVDLALIAVLLLTSCRPAVNLVPIESSPTIISNSFTPYLVTPSPDFIENTPAPTQMLPVIVLQKSPEVKTTVYKTILPQESQEIIINPGKGWILYYPNEEKSREIWDLVSVCYSRLDWNSIEPTEGHYQWDDLDNGISKCSNLGKKFAFGIMPANSSTRNEYVTPRWVFTAGARSTKYKGEIDQWILAPVWNDPVYVEKMQNLIQALALRYDGNPDIAFIDARNCGDWGEWHSLGCSELTLKEQSALIDQWHVFKQTVVVVPTNGDIAEYQARYGADMYGFGIRRDSSETDQKAAGYVFDHSPAVSEWSTTYGMLKKCLGWSRVCWAANLIPDYMSKSKFSYDNLGQWGADSLNFYSENTALVREWANRMGYWFKLTEVNYPANLGMGSTETISFKIRNDGVAPIYVNKNKTYVRLALIDSNGLVLAISDPLPEINPYSWKPGLVSTETSNFTFPQTQGAASLAIGLFSNAYISKPDIRLGNIGVLSNDWFPLEGDLTP